MFWNIWDEIERMQEEIDNLWGLEKTPKKGLIGHRTDPNLPAKESVRTPTCNIKETDNKYYAAFELPGVDKKDIELNITENSIEIKAEKKQEQETKEKNKYSYYAVHGSFYRNIPLPKKIDPDKSVAAYENGVLKVDLPKQEIDGNRKRIEIK